MNRALVVTIMLLGVAVGAMTMAAYANENLYALIFAAVSAVWGIFIGIDAHREYLKEKG